MGGGGGRGGGAKEKEENKKVSYLIPSLCINQNLHLFLSFVYLKPSTRTMNCENGLNGKKSPWFLSECMLKVFFSPVHWLHMVFLGERKVPATR